MDYQRQHEERKIYKHYSEELNYRLIQYNELPEFIKELENPTKTENILTKRIRPNVDHINEDSDDSLSYPQKKKKNTVNKTESSMMNLSPQNYNENEETKNPLLKQINNNRMEIED